MKHCSGKYFYCSDKEARCLSDFDSCAKTKMKEVVQIVDNSVDGVPKYYSADLCAFKLRFQQVDTAQVLDQGWVISHYFVRRYRAGCSKRWVPGCIKMR